MRAILALGALAALWRQAASQAFDYVIIGGGTTGLVLANRLSANPNITVAVIEAGGDVRGNPNVTVISDWTNSQGSWVDYGFLSQPLGTANWRVLEYHAGKAIGGTSTINGMTYIRGDKAEFDAWEKLGNPGWNWNAMFEYFKESENFTDPTDAQVAAGVTYNPDFHGKNGLVHVSFVPDLDTTSPFYNVSRLTWRNLGIDKIEDVNGGKVHGLSVWPHTVDFDANTRADAATSYYWPVAGRSNLVMLRGTARELLWDEDRRDANNRRVRGVDYIDHDQSRHKTVTADREVIISAGSLRTPLILEMSGIGNSLVLKHAGIRTKIDLPGVGENLQDQQKQNFSYGTRFHVDGTTPYVTYVTARDLWGSETSRVADRTRNQLEHWAQKLAWRGFNKLTMSQIKKQLEIQHDLIFVDNVSIGEIITTAHGSDILSVWWSLLPLSRGSVHLSNNSDQAMYSPVISAPYMWVSFDLEMQMAVGKLARAYYNTSPLKEWVDWNTVPGTKVLPEHANDKQWADFIRSEFISNSHQLGTASMMARELGGVVDPNFKVYGTQNLRVADASVVPIQISGHLTPTLYALGERASKIILESWKKSE